MISPPEKAVVWIVDSEGHPIKKAEEAYMWTWEGAKQWYYAKDFPPPAQGKKERRKANTTATWTGLQWRYSV